MAAAAWLGSVQAVAAQQAGASSSTAMQLLHGALESVHCGDLLKPRGCVTPVERSRHQEPADAVCLKL